MAWRATQLRLEEAKLEQMQAGVRALERRVEALLEQAREAEQIRESGSASGWELANLDVYRGWAAGEQRKLAATRTGWMKRIAAQMQVIAQKKLDVRLLERLKEQRLAVWNTDLQREIHQQAEESYLARWNR